MRRLLIICALLSASCESSVTPSLINVSDTVAYRVIGSNTINLILIDYATPTNGIVSVSSNLLTPFNSGPIVGFGQLVASYPTLTVTVLQSGCIEGQILVNAAVVRLVKGCGPGTFSTWLR